MGRSGLVTALAVGSMLATAGATSGQEHSRPNSTVGISFVTGQPVGDLALFFDQGFGVQLDGSFPMSSGGHLRLRTDLGLLVYGHERLRYCYTLPIGCRIEEDVTTMNNIVYVGIGPELALPMGPLEPYVYGTTGLSYFATVSSLGDGWGHVDWGETTNYSDLLIAFKLGGGIRLRVAPGRRPVSLDFGVERHRNGIADFLAEGDIVDNPDGSITLHPNQSQANLTTFRFGLSVGLGGGD
jgi:hypothetical protein